MRKQEQNEQGQAEPRQPKPSRPRPAGTPREAQERVIEKAARRESWLKMLLRERREAKGKPRRWPWLGRRRSDDEA